MQGSTARDMGRRGVLRLAGVGAPALALGRGAARPAAAQATDGLSPRAALDRLMEGNRRFVAGTPRHPNQDPGRRDAVAGGQQPFAIVLCCSDSRVPPELIFDQGIGDLFVVRVAGNVVDEAGLASLEFATAEFLSPVLLVLGHSECGAVKAAIEVTRTGIRPGGALGGLVNRIVPAVERARDAPGDLLANALRANVDLGIEQILRSEPILATREGSGQLDITGGLYDLASGTVTLTGG
jgi:carbonic anhydrase